jgi:hypothetical protein
MQMDNIGRTLLADYQTFPASKGRTGGVMSRSNVIVVNPAKILATRGSAELGLELA